METLQNQPDESASIIADLYKVTPDYVRKLITGQRSPNGKNAKLKAKAILRTYWAYKTGKNQLLERVKRTVKF